ncbi:MAG: immunoglobulin domain-containing protein [FCB group bacterium]|jgi:thiol-disulfide isomerase/thioredoxin|nr:immunoglobulin domain-containing protein [FCB group bacterium]
MKKRGWVLLFLVCTLMASSGAWAIAIGSPAHLYLTYNWVKNPPSHFLDGSHITVIELWATWCGPCYSAVPVLTQLQSQYQDSVQIAGVSREPADLVVPYVEDQGDRMNYSVAYRGEFVWAYYNDGYYSHAVIIDQSLHVIWQGSAFDLAEPLAEAVDAGVFVKNHPVGGVLTEGQDLTLSVELTRDVPVSYAWTRNGQPVGGNTATLSLPSVSSADHGDYVCTITRTDNPDVSVQTSNAAVRVLPSGDLPLLSFSGMVAMAVVLLLGGIFVLRYKLNAA